MQQGDAQQIFGWAMYDWANSAYILIVGTAVFPVYFAQAVVPPGGLVVLNTHLSATALWGYMVSISAVLIFLFGPVLGAVADLFAAKRRLLQCFCFAGSGTVLALSLVPPYMIRTIMVLFVLAHICFAGANVFYDAFLPHIAPPGREDWISSKGFAYGYAGGALLLFLILVMMVWRDRLGLDEVQAARLALGGAALWWAGFSLVTFRHLREPEGPGQGAVVKMPGLLACMLTGLRKVGSTLTRVSEHRSVLIFLCAFMVYNDGVQTVISMAAIYGKEELGLTTSVLWLTLLAVQIVAAPGALFFGKLGKMISAGYALMLSLVIWSGVAVFAYFIHSPRAYFLLGLCVGFVLGGTQSLSRSFYATLIPREQSAEYYGFYSVFAKISVIFGPLIFAFFHQLTGSSRSAVLVMIVFFLAGLVLLGMLMAGRLRQRGS